MLLLAIHSPDGGRNVATNLSTFGTACFQKSSHVVENNDVVVVPSWSDEQVQELESLSTLLESAKHNAKFPEEMEFAKRQLIEIRGRLTETGQAIDDWQGGLVDVESALQDLISIPPLTSDFSSMEHVPDSFFEPMKFWDFSKTWSRRP